MALYAPDRRCEPIATAAGHGEVRRGVRPRWSGSVRSRSYASYLASCSSQGRVLFPRSASPAHRFGAEAISRTLLPLARSSRDGWERLATCAGWRVAVGGLPDDAEG